VKLLILLGALLAPGAATAETCVVADPTGTPLNVRKSPNGPIVGALNNDVRVSIRGHRGDWVNVIPDRAAGKSGWVVKKFLRCGDLGPLGVPTRAEIDGDLILYACTSSDPTDRGFCHVYMTAVRDTLALRTVIKDEFPICMTGNITSRQLADVVVKYIKDNPKDRHLNAATVAALAFRDAWPCSR
jgi:Rap1a immunity proteins